MRRFLPEDKPLRTALIGTVFYILVASGYIQLSGQIAAARAETVEDMRRIETAKGKAFILFTGGMFLATSLGWWRITRRQRNLLIESERRNMISTYNATLAHDLGNLLMGLSGLLQEVEETSVLTGEAKHLQACVSASCDRLGCFSKRVAKQGVSAASSAEYGLAARVGEMTDILKKHPDVRLCRLEVELEDSLTLRASPALLDQAVLNLVVNAAQAAGPGGTVRIHSHNTESGARLEIHDSGPGIPPELRERVFEAGFTRKEGGCGLGMLSVRAFAEESRAKLRIDASPDLGGCRIILDLPLAA